MSDNNCIYLGSTDFFAKKRIVFILDSPMHTEVVSLLQRVSNTRKREITLDVEMEDYHRIKSER